MSCWKILVTAAYIQPVIERFRPLFGDGGVEFVLPPVNERCEEEDLLPLVGDVDGVVCGDDRFTERVLQAAPRLKVISKWGTGVDSIDREACRQRGIAVRNTPNAFSDPVADTVLAYMLCFARRSPWMDRAMRTGIWQKVPSVSLRELTLGVVGVGSVGKAVVRRAVAFGMRVLGNDVVEMPQEFCSETGLAMGSLEALLCNSDFVSINCDLNPTSYRLIGPREIGLMRRNAVLINTARGPIVHEAALVQALKEGRIGGAALDVFEVEPLPVDSPLRAMDNVMLASHNANGSPAAWERVHLNTIKNLVEELERKHQ